MATRPRTLLTFASTGLALAPFHETRNAAAEYLPIPAMRDSSSASSGIRPASTNAAPSFLRYAVLLFTSPSGRMTRAISPSLAEARWEGDG